MSEVAIRPRPALVGLIAFGLAALAVAAVGGLSASSAARPAAFQK